MDDNTYLVEQTDEAIYDLVNYSFEYSEPDEVDIATDEMIADYFVEDIDYIDLIKDEREGFDYDW